MNNTQLTYGTDYKTEKDVVAQCLINIRHIENVIDLKGLDFIDTYLSERYNKLIKESEEKKDEK